MFRRLPIMGAFVVLLCAQPASTPITADLRAEYWQAQFDRAEAWRVVFEAQIKASREDVKLNQLLGKLHQTCNDLKMILVEDNKKQPTCIPQPTPASSVKGTK